MVSRGTTLSTIVTHGEIPVRSFVLRPHKSLLLYKDAVTGKREIKIQFLIISYTLQMQSRLSDMLAHL